MGVENGYDNIFIIIVISNKAKINDIIIANVEIIGNHFKILIHIAEVFIMME